MDAPSALGMVSSLVLGVFGRECVKVVSDRMLTKESNGNGNGKRSFWAPVIREETSVSMRDALSSTVVPMLSSNQKTLDQLVQINSDMKDALLRLVVIQEERKPVRRR